VGSLATIVHDLRGVPNIFDEDWRQVGDEKKNGN